MEERGEKDGWDLRGWRRTGQMTKTAATTMRHRTTGTIK